jgi:hypothetical protein
MANEPKSRPGIVDRLRAWREQRRNTARERRASVEQRINEERYYRGPGAPGGGGG